MMLYYFVQKIAVGDNIKNKFNTLLLLSKSLTSATDDLDLTF